MSTPERWLPAVGWDGRYEVSDMGRVRRLYKTREPRILATREHKQRGYVVVDLKQGERRKTWKLHRLVLETFVGPRPPGLVSRHLNDDKRDNRLVNLAYGTHRENAQDRLRNGVNPFVNRTHCPQGHGYTPENTTRVGSRRHCRTCHREHQRRYLERKRKAA